MTMLIAVAVIVVVALAAGAVAMARRKRKPAALPEEDNRVAELPEEPVAYKPIPKAKAAQRAPPARRLRPVPASAGPAAAAPASTAPAPSHPAPGMNEEAIAREAIDNLERILRDAEEGGLDTEKARQSLKIARSFFDMRKYQKVTHYCKMTEDQLGLQPLDRGTGLPARRFTGPPVPQ
jgi:hypothetical protein